MNAALMQRLQSSSQTSCSRQTAAAGCSTHRVSTSLRHTSLLCRPSQGKSSRGRLQIVAGERQSSNVTTKRRLTGGTGLPPIDGGDDGGGGGGDGWGWEKTARNVLPNLAFLGMYFAITSFGGDGWGNGNFFGGGGGGGGGGGDGHFGPGASQPNGSGLHMDEHAANDHAGDEEATSSEEDNNSEEGAPVHSYGYHSRREYR